MFFRLTHSLTHSLTHLLTHSLTYSLTHSLTYSLTHSLTRSLTYLLTHSSYPVLPSGSKFWKTRKKKEIACAHRCCYCCGWRLLWCLWQQRQQQIPGTRFSINLLKDKPYFLTVDSFAPSKAPSFAPSTAPSFAPSTAPR